MALRASMSVPSSTARVRYAKHNRMPSAAIPSAIGWKPGAQKASRLCESASMPVQPVMRAGRPTVSSGSANTRAGSMFGWKMMRLV